jgi:dTDP-4-dehydrorhamnose 3,5-epimerase
MDALVPFTIKGIVKFAETALRGAFEIDLEPHADERGFFARTWCQDEFEAHGLNSRIVQCSVSFNNRAGTLRGLHYQASPHEETKVVRCTAGAVFDVIVDLRPGSPTLGRYHAVILSSTNRRVLYIPGGIAHGFQTLENDTEVAYARGVRWNDPAFGITWPDATERTMNDRDRTYPDFQWPVSGNTTDALLEER